MRITTKIKTNADLSTSTGSASYAPIAPGFYDALVTKMEVGAYRAGFGQYKNPDSPDGKWEYLKIVPSVVILNDQRTIINRQDFTVGVVFQGALYRPDEDLDKLPIFGGHRGAQFLLMALGLFQETEDGYCLDFDPDTIADRIVRVRTGLGGYVKGVTTFDVDELHKELSGVAGTSEFTFKDVPELVARWNSVKGYTDEDGNELEEGVSLKIKNTIIGWYAMPPNIAVNEGYYVDGEMIFLNEESHRYYRSLKDQDLSDEPSDW